MSETLAGRLKRTREMSGLSARSLSKLAGLSAAHVSLIEADRPNLEAQTAAKLARVLGVTMEWLVNGTGDGPSAAAVAAAVHLAQSTPSSDPANDDADTKRDTG
jgi:transcriptional regulator with XRE-family HTH domain